MTSLRDLSFFICLTWAFTKFVKSKLVDTQPPVWKCCHKSFIVSVDMHMHVARLHATDINQNCTEILAGSSDVVKPKTVFRRVGAEENNPQVSEIEKNLPTCFHDGDTEYAWLPKLDCLKENPQTENGRILLFYKYRPITCPEHVKAWQSELCSRLHLTGKVRVATEGINATVGGSTEATQIYMECMMSHPLFEDMTSDDFKTSLGSVHDFPEGAKVGIFQEIVPLGIPANLLSYTDSGPHLTPEEFHNAVDRHLQLNDGGSLFVDCRNFYESKIGKFDGAIAPDLRKFSYWPEYVDKNVEAFKGKDVFMYCTGGIRCERGSAYLKKKGVCKNVFQLKGGIHKYMEKFPDGHFRGKLFVFDNRYTIQSSDDVIACCSYCNKPWDRYQQCSSAHCHQLVLSCDGCRGDGKTTCCLKCKDNKDKGMCKEECACTVNRPRVPTILE